MLIYPIIMDKSDLVARIIPHLSLPSSLGNPIYGQELNLSSVVVLIHFTRSTPHVILTKRSHTLKSHGGEISFPGGRFMKEEIGINLARDDILGCLSSVKTLTSNFFIVPFVSILQNISQPIPFTDEVEAILDLPLVSLLTTMSPDTEHVSIDELFKFNYDSYLIWGATARILKQLNKFLIQIDT